MFTYIDPAVRERLIASGKLIRIDERGHVIDPRIPPESGQLALNVLGPVPLPVQIPGKKILVQWYAVVRHTELAKVEELASTLTQHGSHELFATLSSSMAVNSVLAVGEPASAPLVRVHSSCLTGDVFGSERCECGPQLQSALERIANDPEGGYLIYMSGHEGRGIGLWAKAATYLLQDGGEDTYQANRSLGLPDDSRDFSDAAALLHYFVGSNPIRLLTNNPKKVQDLESYGIKDVTRVKHVVGVGDWNRRYLTAKRDRGHALSGSDLGDQSDAPEAENQP